MTARGTMTHPTFSVIVPTCGRPAALARCLAGLATLDWPRDRYEVVVVDDGATPPVTVPPDTPLRVRIERQARSGPAAARNRGARVATGTFLAFIDDDCVPDRHWLTALAAALASVPGCGAGGQVVNALPANPWAEASQLLVSFLCEYYNLERANARFFTSNNLAFPRDAFLSAGGFDATYQRAAAEDRELCDRWTAAGRRLVAVPHAIVAHAHDLTLRAFWRQHFTYGRGAWGYRQARARRHARPVRLEPLGFYRGLLAFPMRVHGARGLGHSLALAVAQAANAAGFLAEAVAGREKVPPDRGRVDGAAPRA